MKRMILYVAVTTFDGHYMVVAAGSNRSRVAKAASEIIGSGDIYSDTEQKNLVVVSKTAAKRRYGIDYDNSERWLDQQRHGYQFLD